MARQSCGQEGCPRYEEIAGVCFVWGRMSFSHRQIRGCTYSRGHRSRWNFRSLRGADTAFDGKSQPSGYPVILERIIVIMTAESPLVFLR